MLLCWLAWGLWRSNRRLCWTPQRTLHGAVQSLLVHHRLVRLMAFLWKALLHLWWGRPFSEPKRLTSLAFRKFLVKVFRTWVTLENGSGIHEGFTVKWVLQNFVYLKISHFVLTSCLDSSHSQQRERYEEVIHLLYWGDLSGQDESAPLDAELLPPGAGSEQPPARQTAALRGDESQVPLARWNL